MRKRMLVLSIGSVVLLGGLAYAQRDGDAPARDGKPEAKKCDGECGPRGPRGGEEGRPRGPRDGERRGDRPGPPPNPFMIALDTDKDGELSAEEIANAAVALKALDKNNDGKLSGDETHPPHPPRDGDRHRGGPRDGGRRPKGDRPPRDGDRRPEGDRPPRDGDKK